MDWKVGLIGELLNLNITSKWIQEYGSNYITKKIMTPQEKYALLFSEMEEMGFEFFDYQEDVENLIKKNWIICIT